LGGCHDHLVVLLAAVIVRFPARRDEAQGFDWPRGSGCRRGVSIEPGQRGTEERKFSTCPLHGAVGADQGGPGVSPAQPVVQFACRPSTHDYAALFDLGALCRHRLDRGDDRETTGGDIVETSAIVEDRVRSRPACQITAQMRLLFQRRRNLVLTPHVLVVDQVICLAQIGEGSLPAGFGIDVTRVAAQRQQRRGGVGGASRGIE
jgi:hypothetical protein